MKKNIFCAILIFTAFSFSAISVQNFDSKYQREILEEQSKSQIFYNTKEILETKQLPYITQTIWQEVVDPISKISYSIPRNVYDMVAKQIAGIYVAKNFQNSGIFADYLKFITNKWDSLNDISLSKINKWTDENISPYIKDVNTVFYPLGGPDAAYALKFFPHATCYILVGLELTGNFYQAKTAIDKEQAFLSLKEALTSYFEKGYFITSEMMTQLNKKDLVGTLQIILFELARMGAQIENITNYSINSSGTMVPKTKKSPKCVCISFYYQEKKRYLYYVSSNLENRVMALDNLFNFVKKFKFISFIKSASYALHDKHFTRLLNFILNYSTGILQDDTGIPFNIINNSIWHKKGFGSYTKPTLKVFKDYIQPDLAEFFNSQSIEPIPFKIGYGFDKNRPNLLFLLRKTPVNYFLKNRLNLEKNNIQYSIK